MSSLSGRAPCAMAPASNTALANGISKIASVARRRTDRRPRRSRHNCQEWVGGSFIVRASDTHCENEANSAKTAADSWFPQIIRPFSARYCYAQLTHRIACAWYHFRVVLIRHVRSQACVQTFCRNGTKSRGQLLRETVEEQEQNTHKLRRVM